MKRIATVVLFLALAACSKKKDNDTGTGGVASNADMGAPPKGSAAPTGSAAGSDTGSGSAAVPAAAGSGSGSGSGSDAGSGSAAAAGSGSGSDAGSAVAAAFEFDKLTHEEKAEFMKTKVVPAMKIEFQKFDPKHYANFGCKTCHGKDPKATKFKMPSPDLPKLDFAALEAGKQKPEVAKWMGQVVKPQMAKIMGEKEFDPKHPEAGGFGCLECHEQKK